MSSSQPADTFRGRVGSRWKSVALYLLLNVNRFVFAIALAVLVCGLVVLLGATAARSLREMMRAGAPVDYLFQAFVGAVITGVTLVVTINQLVFSREASPLGDQQQNLREELDFRDTAADAIGSPSPPEPSSFLRALVEAAGHRAAEFGDAIADHTQLPVHEEILAFTDEVQQNADAAGERLESAQFGTYEVLGAALDFNYAWKLHQLRRFRREHGDALDDTQRAALSRLLEVLRLFAAAREYMKTLYIQWTLVDLSKSILYTAVPALLISASVLLYVDAGTLPGSTLGIDNMIWLVSAASAAVVFPFLLLLAYILRLATIAKLTADVGPFVLRESERSHEIDWD